MSKAFPISSALALILLSFLVEGCSLADRNRTRMRPEEEITAATASTGDAYLFDVKIERDGKKNSFRLDVYQSGDSISWFARGYLGKGVMKGLLADDSIIVYFPTEDEFYSGKLNSLAEKSCLGEMELEPLMAKIFRQIPTMVALASENFYLTILNEEEKERLYLLNYKNCPGGIELEYQNSGGRYFISKIEYKGESDSFGFLAKMRNFRLNIKLPSDKFEIGIPASASRISP